MSVGRFLTIINRNDSIHPPMIVRASIIVTGKHQRALYGGAVFISHGTIIDAGPASAIIRRFPGKKIVQFPGAVLMPGLVNVHAHLELPFLRNSIRANSFSGWVLNLIQAKKGLKQSDYVLSSKDNINALMQTGTTTVGEICTHGTSPILLKKSGLRTVVFDEIIRMEDREGKSSDFKVQSQGLRQSSLLQHGLSPHTPYTVSEKVLREVAAMAAKKDLKLAVHVAESKDEIRLLQRKKNGLEKLYQFAHWDLSLAPKGTSSFEYLNRIGFISPRLLAVHAVQVTDHDIILMKRAKVSVAHCPRSNKELGVGKMPLKKFLDAGITVGLGTDSLASVPTLNMWDEMRYAYKIHHRDGVSAEDIFRIATIGGAKALGWDKEIGALEPGRKADIIAVPLPKKNTGDLYSDLLRETKSCIMTMVNGKIVYQK